MAAPRHPVRVGPRFPVRVNMADPYNGDTDNIALAWNLFQPDPIVGPEPVFSVASPNYDENGNNIGNNPRVDSGKGLWMGGQVANLFTGDSSQARSVTLTAQAYTLFVWSGSASCSYGTATPGSPLKFTATAGTTVFTPTGVSKWLLVAGTFGAMPYVPPGATQLANAATTGGNGTNIPLDAGLTAAYSGQNSFLDRFYFGFSSAQVSSDTALRSVRNATTDVLYVSSGGVIKSSDGTNTATVTVAGGWPADQIISLYRRTNGTQMQVGYRKAGETAITWGALATYDGSDNPGTHERCCLNGTLPIWGQAKSTANKYCTDSELLEMEALAA